MRTSRRNSNLRRYRNLPTHAVLALLAEGREEEYFIASHSLRRRK